MNAGNNTRSIHLVSGPPAAGKTTYARQLAEEIGAVLLDSDEVAERLVRAGMTLAGIDPDDRDSPAYKAAFRDAVYETLFDLAVSHAARLPVVIAGPFTREGGDAEWPERMRERLGILPEFHYVWCHPDERKRRVSLRGAARDLPKLADWDTYVANCREIPPVFPHRWIDTTGNPGLTGSCPADCNETTGFWKPAKTTPAPSQNVRSVSLGEDRLDSAFRTDDDIGRSVPMRGSP
jgi:AAA domain